MRNRLYFVPLVLLMGCATIAQVPNLCERATSVPMPADVSLPGYLVKRSGAPRVIVFVHGLGGDGRSTWTNQATRTYWPALLKDDPAFEGFNVYVYQYPTNPVGACMSVTDIANDMRLRLLADKVLGEHNQIIFVAHSLGGLVVRTFLVRNRESIAPKVPMVFFYGTPSAGAVEANIASRFTQCLQVDDLRMIDANSFLQNQSSDWLSAGLQERVVSYCAFEVPPNSATVGRTSATYLCSKDPQPIYANHSEVVKPACANDTPHVFLRTAVQNLPSPTPVPSSPQEALKEIQNRNTYLEEQLDRRFRNRAIREQLGRFLLEGQKWEDIARKGPPVPLPEAEAQGWFDQTRRYLLQNLDSSYEARFVSPGQGLPYSYRVPKEYESLIRGMSLRLDMLRRFIEELKD
jgi:Alpha/beta hydrolase family